MNPSFQLIDVGWDKVFAEAVLADRTELRVVCPFIKLKAVKRLLIGTRPSVIQIVTRFHLGEMCDGVNDTEALRLLLDHGAQIRGIKGLHAKLYLFGDRRAIVSSANLTEAALLRNHEFGFVTNEQKIMKRCRKYFDFMWGRAGKNLTLERLKAWETKIASVRLQGARPSTKSGLPDEGVNAGAMSQKVILPPRVTEAPLAFVKFFGEGDSRAAVTLSVFMEVSRSGCHWACSYPANKRPRQVKDGSVIFMGRLVGPPNDVIIYGRAIGLKHDDVRDVATTAEIALRPWKANWPAYVRVFDAEFLAGTLGNGISLNELMSKFKEDSFTSTQENARLGVGNKDPRSACRQKAAMTLTPESSRWLNERLERAFERFGKITPAELETLDWPQSRLAAASSARRGQGLGFVV